MINRQGVYVDTETISFGAGFSLNHWTGIGFRNYFSVNTGLKFVPKNLQENRLNFGVSLYADHNHRLNLRKLTYFTYGVGYSPIFSLNPAPEMNYKRDLLRHQFYISSGMNFIYRKWKIATLVNIGWLEMKQYLFYTGTRSYLQIYPSLTIRFSYFYRQKVL